MSQRDDRAEEQVRELIEEAGPRPSMAPERLEAIRRAARASWRGSLEEPPDGSAGRSWSRVGPLAVAASVLALLAAATWWGLVSGWLGTGPDAVAEAVAVVERVTGARVASGSRAPEALTVDRRLAAGDVVETGGEAAFAALRLPTGGSLRLAPGSRVELVSPSEIALVLGAVYFDSGSVEPVRASALTVHTAWGVVEDVGTQFEVRILEGREELGAGAVLRVRVREGEARWRGPATEASAGRGEELELGRDGNVERAEIDPAGDAWTWVLESAPPLRLEGRTLGELLDWVARETGWQVRFEDRRLARLRSEIMHGGDVQRPDRDYVELLHANGLEGVVEDGVLTVRALASVAD
ncbi:MAG TPA: FecR family protein [Thermoanaerobaculia bacterium]|nr:FecR family protein [Thermoanaerobaculia bacterium]